MGIEPTSEAWEVNSLVAVLLLAAIVGFFSLRFVSVVDHANSDLLAISSRNALCRFPLDRFADLPRRFCLPSSCSRNLLHSERVSPRCTLVESPVLALSFQKSSLDHFRVAVADGVPAGSAARVWARATFLPTERLCLFGIPSAWHCFSHSSECQVLHELRNCLHSLLTCRTVGPSGRLGTTDFGTARPAYPPCTSLRRFYRFCRICQNVE